MSVRLNASGDILYRTANLPAFSAFTVAGWFHRVAAQAGSFIYLLSLENTTYPTDSTQYNLLGIDNSGVLHIANSGAGTNFGSTPATGTWFYAWLRGNGTNLQGGWATPGAAAFTTVSQSQGNVFTPATLALGSDTFDEFLDGRIAQARAWDAALTDAELLAEMRAAVPVRWANLNFAWRLATATDTADKTSNARSATVGGSIATEDGPPVRGFARGFTGIPLRVQSGGVTVTITGVSATAQAGDILAKGSAVAQATGVTATGSAGDITASGDATAALSGVAATGAAGSIGASGAALIELAGVSSSGVPGEVTIAADGGVIVAVAGVSSTGEVGALIVRGDAVVPLQGVQAAAAAGNVEAISRITVAVPSVSATGQAGLVTVTGHASVPLTGAEAQAVVGVLLAIGQGQAAPTSRVITIEAENRTVTVSVEITTLVMQ
jgi:hypothetical protein